MSRNAQQELEKLESRGREVVQQQQDSESRAREAAQREQRLKASRQLKRYIGSYQTRALPPVILLMVWPAMAYYFWHLGADIPLALFLGLIAGGIGFSFPTWIIGSVAAERRWVTSLPYRMNGFFETLSIWDDSPVVFEIAFANEEPSTESLHALFVVTDPGVEVTHGDGTLRAKFPTPRVGGGSDGMGGSSNSRPYGPDVVALVHKVAKTLTLLHSKYAIDRVDVKL